MAEATKTPRGSSSLFPSQKSSLPKELSGNKLLIPEKSMAKAKAVTQTKSPPMVGVPDFFDEAWKKSGRWLRL